MNYVLNPRNPLDAPALNLLLCGGIIREDTEEMLIIERNLLTVGAGSVDKSERFQSSLMALCPDGNTGKALFDSGRFESMVECVQYAYLKDSIDVSIPEGVALRRLTEEDVPFLCVNYHHPSATPRHMRERIAECMIGAFIDGRCAGFAGIHEEDSIGMLEVLPEFRRRGIARALVGELVRYQLARGHIPYGQARVGNTASMRLQESLGFTKAKNTVCWLCKDTLYRAKNLF